MKLRQMISEAARALDATDTADIARALYDLADNGSGESMYAFLGAIRPLASYAKEAGI